MLTAGQTIDIFHRIIKPLDSFTTYECDTAGVLRIHAFGREVVRFFSGNGEAWVFFKGIDGCTETRCEKIKTHFFPPIALYLAIRRATYEERGAKRIKRKYTEIFNSAKKSI
jgi:hypothetical protein